MKIRESGMPEREMWESFFDVSHILSTLGINKTINDVAEFGCGYGTFTIEAAKVIGGKIYALDIESEMIKFTQNTARKHNLQNIKTIQRDFIEQGSGLSDNSVEYVMLFNILHFEKPWLLLREAKRILKDDGKIGIIHWNYTPDTPRGPPMEIRPKPEDCFKWADSEGFRNPIQHDLKPYHYGMVLTK